MDKFEYQEHQNEAVHSIIEELTDFDRTQLISACGTGKTVIAKKASYDIVKSNSNALIIVFMPTLTLINQFNQVWKNKHPEINFDDEPFIFCSDKKTVTESQKKTSGIDTKKLKLFLQNDNIQFKIILTTYQSSKTLCDYLKYTNSSIDFGVFDEAHKTVGLEDKDFAYALYDKNIYIKKRLFMTATKIKVEDSDYLKKLSRSGNVKAMDDVVTYGRVAYELPMKEAIRRNIIKDFKVVVGVIDESFIEKCKGTIALDDKFYSNVLAYSYIKALQEKNIKKSIVFNGRVKDSKEFVSLDIISRELGGLIEHIDGETDYQIRENALEELKSNKEKHISNAKLFSEGVDVPSVNMVGFFTPSRSIVDIIQRLGRMQRKESADDNSSGLVFLPLFVDNTKNLNLMEFYSRFNWDYIINVLEYLKDSNTQIESLFSKSKKGTLIKDDIKEFFINSGAIEFTGSNIDFDDRIIEALENRIKITTFDNTINNWDERFTQVLEFKNINNKFPTHSEKNKGSFDYILAVWCQIQRTSFKNKVLTQKRINKLKNIGFQFTPLKENWNNKCDEYIKYKTKHKKEPQAKRNGEYTSTEERSLNKWINDQKRFYKKNTLDDWKIKKLEEHIDSWDNAKEIKWNNFYNKFESIFKKYKRMPFDNKAEGDVCNWIRLQRNKYLNDKLEDEHIEKLNTVSSDWKKDKFELAWETNYNELKNFVDKHKRLPSDRNESVDSEKKIYKWIIDQRLQLNRKSKKLTQERTQKLNTFGILDNPMRIPSDFQFPSNVKCIKDNAVKYGYVQMSFNEIAEELELTRGQVFNANESAMNKIRNYIIKNDLSSELLDFFNVDCA